MENSVATSVTTFGSLSIMFVVLSLAVFDGVVGAVMLIGAAVAGLVALMALFKAIDETRREHPSNPDR